MGARIKEGGQPFVDNYQGTSMLGAFLGVLIVSLPLFVVIFIVGKLLFQE
jgi:hypothetical protein